MIVKLNIEEIANELELSNVLIYRPLGKKAKEMILEKVDTLNSGDSIEMDFSNIELCDVSFVDEMIIEVQLFMRQRENILMCIKNVKQEIFENLEAALALREQKNKIKIQILHRLQTGYKLVGIIEQNLQETFNLVANGRQISARDVAEVYELEINSASNRLKKLYDSCLVLRKEQIDINGRQHIYFLPI